MSTVTEQLSPIRPTWAEIDLDLFADNVAAIKTILPPGSGLVAVLKANGYGHGALELARACESNVAMIATALLEEALQLRQAGIRCPLLVLGPLEAAQIAVCLAADITPAAVGPEQLALLSEAARERDLGFHLKLDTGMGRMGITEWELPAAMALMHASKRLRVEGIYTHFANADVDGDTFTAVQTETYDRMLATLRAAGIDAPLHHFANSAATLRGLVRPGDLARVGIALYGASEHELFAETEAKSGILPVMRWRTAIARIKTLPEGHAIGYGTTFRTSRSSRIATLPVGYADGYDRRLSNTGEVLVRGRRVPVVGRVSMDLVTIDVTEIEDAAVGDEVVLLGEQGDERITADEIASRIGTIAYEVFCSISARVPRIYRGGGAWHGLSPSHQSFLQ